MVAMPAKSAAERQRECRLQKTMLAVTLDRMESARLERIVDRTGESKADWVRRMIRETDPHHAT
jgi:hypothetical protein